MAETQDMQDLIRLVSERLRYRFEGPRIYDSDESDSDESDSDESDFDIDNYIAENNSEDDDDYSEDEDDYENSDYKLREIENILRTGNIVINLRMITDKEKHPPGTRISLLQHAYEYQDLKLFSLLLKYGANPNSLYIDYPNRPIFIEVLYNYMEYGDIPLDYVKLLLIYGAQINDLTVLQGIVESESIDLMNVILMYSNNINVYRTLRQYAIQDQNESVLDFLDEYMYTNLQSKRRGKLTRRRLKNRYEQQRDTMLNSLIDQKNIDDYVLDFLKPYHSPLSRRELSRTLARDKRQRMTRKKELAENMRTAKFLNELYM